MHLPILPILWLSAGDSINYVWSWRNLRRDGQATKTLIQEIVNYQACNETGTKTATPLQMFSQNKFLFAICINFVEIDFVSKKNSGQSERGVKPLFWGKASNIEPSIQVSCMVKEKK